MQHHLSLVPLPLSTKALQRSLPFKGGAYLVKATAAPYACSLAHFGMRPAATIIKHGCPNARARRERGRERGRARGRAPPAPPSAPLCPPPLPPPLPPLTPPAPQPLPTALLSKARPLCLSLSLCLFLSVYPSVCVCVREREREMPFTHSSCIQEAQSLHDEMRW